MPSKFITFSSLPLLVLLSSCGPVKDGDIARIHQSWDARFNYDFEKRRLISVNEKRMRGRTWGRDEFGRVNYDRYWTGRPILSQNLLDSYKARMDEKLEDRWQEAESDRVTKRFEEMESETMVGADAENKGKAEGAANENQDGFAPTPFLPEGIDQENEIPEDDKGGGPFIPLPEGPAVPEPDPNALPEVDPESVPSPFAPLPPL